MSTLLLLDDLSEFRESKNRLIQAGLHQYVRYIQFLVRQSLSQHKQKNTKMVIAGPALILDGFHLPNTEKITYEQMVDKIDCRLAGNLSSRLADRWDSSATVKQISPELFLSATSVPKIAFVRLGFLYCYNPIFHYLLIQYLMKTFSIRNIQLLGQGTEIEKIAIALSKREKMPCRILHIYNPVMKMKSVASNYIYCRDRRLHALNALCSSRAARETAQDSVKRKLVCMIPAHSLHFRIMVPLIERLKKSSSYDACVLVQASMDGLVSELERKNIRYYRIEEYQNDPADNDFHDTVKKLKKGWRELKNSCVFQKEFLLEGIDWFEILHDKMKNFFIWSFSEILLLQERLIVALRTIKPKAVFVFSDSRLFEASGAAVARRLGIPVFLYSPNQINSPDQINRYDTADYTMVVGPYIHCHVVEKKYVPHGRIFEVGDVRFDDIPAWKSREVRRKTLEYFGKTEQKQIYTIISAYTCLYFSLDEKKHFFKMIGETADSLHDEMDLIIKGHPNENEIVLKQFVKDIGMEDVPLVKDYPLYELLGISRGIITIGSMASFEAMIFGIPVIVIKFSERDYKQSLPVITGNGSLCVRTSAELTEVIKTLNKNNTVYDRQILNGYEHIKQFVNLADESKAGDRIMNILDQYFEGALK